MNLRFAAGLAVLALLSGCAGQVNNMVSELQNYTNVLELDAVPFYAQVTDQCGPAALASVLTHSGADVTPASLKSQIYIPGRKGSLQFELIAAARRAGRVPYTIDPEINAVLRELEAGRPVLVLQNLGVGMLPIWHYAVVVGYLPNEERLVLRSGDEARHLVDARRFMKTWHRADYWGVVVVKPGELPVDADASRYLRAVADIESTGNPAHAARAYAAATAEWPDNPLAWLGRGNADYQAGNLRSAIDSYETLLKLHPQHHVGLNNLSHVLLELGYHDRALDTINKALRLSGPDDPGSQYLRQTLREIQLAQSETGSTGHL